MPDTSVLGQIGSYISSTGSFLSAGATAAAVAEGGGLALALSNRDPNDTNNTFGGQFYMGDMVYPSDLVNEDIGRNSYINIQFNSYERRSIFDQPFLRARGGITLPLPASLQDATSVNWNASSTDAKNAAVGAGIEQLLKGGGNTKGSAASDSFLSSAIDQLKNITSATADNAGNIAGAAGAAYGAQTISGLLGGAGAQALQLGGLAANPFLTMIFQSPNFKSHSFSWVFSPRNPEESATINSIINALKYNMLPGLAGGESGGGVYFKYPNVANIQLFPSNAYLYKFKPCVVKSVTVDFAPNGPSFFQGTYAPTHISLSIELQEIEYWTREALTDTMAGGDYRSVVGQAAVAFGKSISNAIDTVNQDQQTFQNPLTIPGANPFGS